MFRFGGDAPVVRTHTRRVTTTWSPTTTGSVGLEFAGVGRCTVLVDGRTTRNHRSTTDGQPAGLPKIEN